MRGWRRERVGREGCVEGGRCGGRPQGARVVEEGNWREDVRGGESREWREKWDVTAGGRTVERARGGKRVRELEEGEE